MLIDLAIIIPVYNEEKVLPELFRSLAQLSQRLHTQNTTHHFIFVDDGSTDSSLYLLKQFSQSINTPVTIIKLTRNFGHQQALIAGYSYSHAKYIATIDADLQDDPLLIPQMYNLLKKEKKDVILAQRRKRKEHSLFKLITARLYYKLYNLLADYPIPEEVADFRIISNRIKDSLLNIVSYPPFLRGAISYLGYPSVIFRYDRNPRKAGQTKYSLKKMLQLATTGLLNYSTKATWLIPTFILINGISTLGITYIIYSVYSSHFLSILILLGGILISSLPVIYLLTKYIVQINQILTQKPIFVIDYIYNNEYARNKIRLNKNNPRIKKTTAKIQRIRI